MAEDVVNHPSHYTSHPSGIECIEITEHMGFNLGNALKYIWRADLKGDAIEDLEKAAWYIRREIEKRQQAADRPGVPYCGHAAPREGIPLFCSLGAGHTGPHLALAANGTVLSEWPL
ncbi:DUF3310 domain-containing protein [Jatrophihabitans sp.]|uniref:DUF3310 domain-containing protein n=1 Tax=Jatrophihabitans sp. TaxID=1932789 RepID=UPI0030C6D49F|nr:hypothetical protein [Jatrophihabitans sp.]